MGWAPALARCCFLARRAWGSFWCFLGHGGKKGLQPNFCTPILMPRPPQSPFLEHNMGKHLLLSALWDVTADFIVLSPYLSSCTRALSWAPWITCPWTCFHTFLIIGLTGEMIKNYEPGEVVGAAGRRKLFSLPRLHYKQSLLHLGQNSVWQKENRTVNLMRIYVWWVSLSLYTVLRGIWVIKTGWLMYLYRPGSDPELLLSFENLRFIYLDFLSLKPEWF